MENQTEVTRIPWETSLRYDAFVIGLYVLTLIAGWGLKSWVEAKTNIFTDLDANLSLSYPELWAPKIEKGTLLSIRDLQSEGTFKVMFSAAVKELEPTDIKPVQELVKPFTEDRGQELTTYRILEINDTEVDKLNAVRILYAYVEDPITSSLQTYLPTVVKGVDILVIHGSNLYVFTFASPATTFSQKTETLDAILNSVDFNLED